MRKLLVVLAVVALSTMFTVPALAMPRASPSPIALMSDIDMMMAPTAMATNHHQTFLTEATEARIQMTSNDANFYHGGLDCLPGAQMNQAGFTQDIGETGQELTITTAIKCNCPGCSASVVLNYTESTFTTAEQRHDAANYQHVNWNIPTSVTKRMDAMNVNTARVIILRL